MHPTYAAVKIILYIVNEKIHRPMKSAWRNLMKNKTYMLINLFGLTLGLSVMHFHFALCS